MHSKVPFKKMEHLCRIIALADLVPHQVPFHTNLGIHFFLYNSEAILGLCNRSLILTACTPCFACCAAVQSGAPLLVFASTFAVWSTRWPSFC